MKNYYMISICYSFILSAAIGFAYPSPAAYVIALTGVIFFSVAAWAAGKTEFGVYTSALSAGIGISYQFSDIKPVIIGSFIGTAILCLLLLLEAVLEFRKTRVYTDIDTDEKVRLPSEFQSKIIKNRFGINDTSEIKRFSMLDSMPVEKMLLLDFIKPYTELINEIAKYHARQYRHNNDDTSVGPGESHEYVFSDEEIRASLCQLIATLYMHEHLK